MKNLKMHDAAIDYLRGLRFLDGRLGMALFSKLPLPANAPKRANVIVHPVAFAKMISLIKEFNTEIGWQGFCTRDPQCDTRFILEDIVVYPQVVTGTNITTDETRQGEWLDSFDDETFRKIRFHGHSHVNMSVFSSATDDDLQRDLTNMLRPDDFYLFFIMNKRIEIFARLYDNKFGVVWETEDLNISVSDGTVDFPAFLSSAKDIVKTAPAVPVVNTAVGGKGSKECNYPKHLWPIEDDFPYGYYDKKGQWVPYEGGSIR